MNTTPWWVPVVAAFGASLITTVGTFGVLQWQRWRDGRANAKAAKLAAYSELHARVFAFVLRIGTLGLAKQLRSGIGEGLAVVLGQRRPVDIFELHKWLEEDFRAISDAYTKVCLIGSQEAIDIAGKLLASCSDLIGMATATDQKQRYFVRLLRGETQTVDQVLDFETMRTQLFKEREEFATIIRLEIGHDPVLFPLRRAELDADTKAGRTDQRVD